MNTPHVSSHRRLHAFTLIELLTVIAIIGILAAIIIPVVGKVRDTARVSNTLSNMRQIGTALLTCVGDSKDLLPACQSVKNDPAGLTSVYWHVALNPYVGRSKASTNSDISEFFTCPVYRAMIGRDPYTFKGGYAMNTRIAFIRGPFTYATDDAGGNRLRYSSFTQPSRTIFASFGVDEQFAVNNDGTRSDEQFYKSPTGNDTSLVPHNRRIGAGSDGKGGSSAGYLFLDGSVRNLKPEQVVDNLKRNY